MLNSRRSKRLATNFEDRESNKSLKMESCKENRSPDMDSHEALEKESTTYNKLPLQCTPKKSIQNVQEQVSKKLQVSTADNLLLLSSAASELEYANCGSPKSIRTIKEVILKDGGNDQSSYNVNKKLSVSRKEKSLQIICKKFLDMFPPYPDKESKIIVSLDDVCSKLDVERRRLYDIVNVFESVDMLKKEAKNKYKWFGQTYLKSALYKIKLAAEHENVLAKLKFVFKYEKNSESKQTCILDEVEYFNKNLEVLNFVPLVSPSSELRKEKSLAIMSQRFLMLFLVSSSKVISLGVAAKVLNGFQKTERSAQIKTQIRRLYDIANVLSSIGIIQKEVTVGNSGKKPAFKYIGPDDNELADICILPYMNDSTYLNSSKKTRTLVRHCSSKDILFSVAEKERQRLFLDESANSAPPFDKSLRNEKKFLKTSFSNLGLCSVENGQTWTCNNSNPKKKSKTSSVFQNIQPKVPTNDVKVMQPNLMPHTKIQTVINVLQPALNNDGSYVVLNQINNIDPQPVISVGNVTHINQVPSSNTTEHETSLQMVPILQTVNLSQMQRDTILQSLNISLSNGQIASIQLDGNSSTAQISDEKPQCNQLKIIEKNNPNSMNTNQFNPIQLPSKEISENADSNESSGVFSTKSYNSLNSRLNSPLTISSGCITPVTTTATSFDFSFLSNNKTNSNLKFSDEQEVIPCKSESVDLLKENRSDLNKTKKESVQD
ncbi:transcription factor E2F7, partial [Caerostris darwini]